LINHTTKDVIIIFLRDGISIPGKLPMLLYKVDPGTMPKIDMAKMIIIE